MEKRRYVKGFDTIKGIVVLIAVTIGHYWQFTPAGYYAEGTNKTWVDITNNITKICFNKSFSFMELLLMISGFQLFVYYDRIKSNSITFSEYIIKRAKRLIPIAGISTIIMYIGVAVYYDLFNEYWYNTSAGPAYLIENLFLVQNWVNNFHTLNGPLWYISVYFFCSVLYYFLARVDERHGGIFVMLIPVIVGIIFFSKKSQIPLLNNDMCRGYMGFFLGVVAAYICEKLKNRQLQIYALVSIISFALLYHLMNGYIYSGEMYNRSLPALVLLYAPVLMLLSRFPLLDNIIGNPAFIWLGKASFELCALNFPFYVWLEIANRKFKWGIPYGKVPMYYILAFAQIILAVLLHYIPVWIRMRIAKKPKKSEDKGEIETT